MDISIILTVLHVYLHVKIYQDLHTKYMQFIISQSYVNKAVKIWTDKFLIKKNGTDTLLPARAFVNNKWDDLRER